MYGGLCVVIGQKSPLWPWVVEPYEPSAVVVKLSDCCIKSPTAEASALLRLRLIFCPDLGFILSFAPPPTVSTRPFSCYLTLHGDFAIGKCLESRRIYLFVSPRTVTLKWFHRTAGSSSAFSAAASCAHGFSRRDSIPRVIKLSCLVSAINKSTVRRPRLERDWATEEDGCGAGAEARHGT